MTIAGETGQALVKSKIDSLSVYVLKYSKPEIKIIRKLFQISKQ